MRVSVWLQVVKAELADLHQQMARAMAAQQRAAKANNEVADKVLCCTVGTVEADSQRKSSLQDLRYVALNSMQDEGVGCQLQAIPPGIWILFGS